MVAEGVGSIRRAVRFEILMRAPAFVVQPIGQVEEPLFRHPVLEVRFRLQFEGIKWRIGMLPYGF